MVDAPQVFLKYTNRFMLSIALFCLFEITLLLRYDAHTTTFTLLRCAIRGLPEDLQICASILGNISFIPGGKFTARGKMKWLAQGERTAPPGQR